MARPLRTAFILLLPAITGLSCIHAADTAGAASDVVRLSNGDRLSGRIVSRENGTLVLVSPVLGRIEIPEENVVTATPPSSITSGGAAVAGTEPGSHKAAQWKKFIEGCTGMVEFGLQDATGRRNSQTISLRGDVSYKAGPNQYKVNAKYYYNNYNDSTLGDRLDAGLRYRHDLNPTYFLQSAAVYYKDTVKEIDHNIEASTGLGWNVLRVNRHELKVGANVLTRYRRIYGIDESFSALAGVFQEYSFRINNRFKLTQDSSMQYSPVDRARFTFINGQIVPANDTAANFRATFNAALQGRLSDKLNLTLRYEYEFDNTIPQVDLKSDRRISSSLGYAF